MNSIWCSESIRFCSGRGVGLPFIPAVQPPKCFAVAFSEDEENFQAEEAPPRGSNMKNSQEEGVFVSCTTASPFVFFLPLQVRVQRQNAAAAPPFQLHIELLYISS